MNDSADDSAERGQLPPIAEHLSPTVRGWIVTAYMATERWQEAIAAGDLVKANQHFDKMHQFWSMIVSQAEAESRDENARQYICNRCYKWFSERDYADPGATVCAPDDQEARPHHKEDFTRLAL